jgi:hypothetical protein
MLNYVTKYTNCRIFIVLIIKLCTVTKYTIRRIFIILIQHFHTLLYQISSFVNVARTTSEENPLTVSQIFNWSH